jgi:hypothetical protein
VVPADRVIDGWHGLFVRIELSQLIAPEVTFVLQDRTQGGEAGGEENAAALGPRCCSRE